MSIPINEAVDLLIAVPHKNRQMPGDPHYQPKPLQPYLGYDFRAGWLVIVEWYWMSALAALDIMPEAHAKLLTPTLLKQLLTRISMTHVTKIERTITKHDILALLREMKRILPKELHCWLHLGCTSYDIICTAYALQARWTYFRVVRPQMLEISKLWKQRILEHARTVQLGRTHLQVAQPVTVGLWLGVLHQRFDDSVQKSQALVSLVGGKFSGAVGTKAAIRALFGYVDIEGKALELLRLPPAKLSTQLTQPQDTARFYFETLLVSSALANLGDDVRHLQATEIGEVSTDSSTSSAMSHKDSNPIAAEQADGMHVSVRSEMEKVTQTLNSTLQRVLTGSSVMRAYGAVTVFTYQQMTTTTRILKSFKVREERCRDNMARFGTYVVAELLHLALQQQGFPDAHKFVNKKLLPKARAAGDDLCSAMDVYVRRSRSSQLKTAWEQVPLSIKQKLFRPELYVGDAVEMAEAEATRV